MCKESDRILYQEQASRHTELLFCTFAAVCIPGVTASGLETRYFCLDSEDLRRGKEARSHRVQNLAKAAGLMLAGSKEKGKAVSWGMSGVGHQDQACASMKISAWVKYGWWEVTVWESHFNITLIQEISG